MLVSGTLANARLSIEVTLLGIVKLVILLLYWLAVDVSDSKALVWICLIPVPKVSCDIGLYAKEPVWIISTLFGITKLSIEL